ncbi:uncharacterized protein NESG_02055 [Nematocida ausubeli]|uniref:HTH La-type RNA-binding domain-containing protein n=1 Tax=Nematocida ausubeli (strain ATCC PRA-371 / ERTm2) TaxID=1913371 RepID=H8ZBX3_NEMA1|nr:uncharacterized protein NESG_02055 [Nematocida ausubeli]EHY65609.1 hypothetical protein NERG_01216 [Nematocida ausubeli]KAI5136666.1 lupus La protein [Nematocida ausubeli]KFG25284.1 hypothetical protein NESG_02055 [Nematocida ausubeli]
MEQREQVRKQVEYYMSDANIVRDEYLKRVMAKNGGWVPVSVMNGFKRMQAFGMSDDEVMSALEGSETVTVDKEHGFRRVHAVPSLEQHCGEARTVIIRGFPLTYTLEDVERVLESISGRVARLVMRRDAKKMFKGSVFAEMRTEEDVDIIKGMRLHAVECSTGGEGSAEECKRKEKVPTIVDSGKEDTDTNGAAAPEEATDSTGGARKKVMHELTIEDAATHITRQKDARKAAKKKKEEERAAATVRAYERKLFKYSSSTGDVSTLKVSDVKNVLAGAAFVDVRGQVVRMKEEHESLPAIEVCEVKVEFVPMTTEEVGVYCAGLSLGPKGVHRR